MRRLIRKDSDPLRLMICIPSLGKGGAERQVCLLAPELARRGVDVAVFGRIERGEAELLEEARVRCFPIAASGNYNPALLIELVSAIRRHRSDAVQTFLPQMDVLGGIAAMLLHRKWVLSERGSNGTYPPSAKISLRRRLGARADAIVANSDGGIKAWPHHRTRFVIPNGVDLAAVQETVQHRPDGSMLVGGTPIIISIARLVTLKGHRVLLLAAARLKAHIPKFKVLLLGEGPLRRVLETEATKLGLNGHVEFLGYRHDVWKWLGQASMLVSMSAAEGHPNAVVEAAAANVPQILSDIPAHRDAVGEDGALFVQLRDDAGLAEAMRKVLTDREGAGARAANALRRVVELSPDHGARQLIAVHRTLIGDRA